MQEQEKNNLIAQEENEREETKYNVDRILLQNNENMEEYEDKL